MIYCSKACVETNDDGSLKNPCGGTGTTSQTPSCESTTFMETSRFAYAPDIDMPTSFIGCSHDVCSNLCAGNGMNTNQISGMNIAPSADGPDGNTYCFPEQTPDGMYFSEEIAKMAAIARGCSGSHAMTINESDMFMIGESHMECMNSYSANGIEFGKEVEDDGHNDSSHNHGDHDGDVVSAINNGDNGDMDTSSSPHAAQLPGMAIAVALSLFAGVLA